MSVRCLNVNPNEAALGQENSYVEHDRKRRGKRRESAPATFRHNLPFGLPVGLPSCVDRGLLRTADFRLTRSGGESVGCRRRSWRYADASLDSWQPRRTDGQNELYTIGVLEGLARAQEEYASEARDGGSIRQFAQKIHSDPGTHDGLYWTVAEGEPESPIGPLIASATAEGYKTGSGGKSDPVPWLLLSNSNQAGHPCPGRREELPGERQNDARIRLPRLSR